MRHLNLRVVLWGIFWTFAIIYFVQHPAQIAGWIVTGKDALITFVTTLAGG